MRDTGAGATAERQAPDRDRAGLRVARGEFPLHDVAIVGRREQVGFARDRAAVAAEPRHLRVDLERRRTGRPQRAIGRVHGVEVHARVAHVGDQHDVDRPRSQHRAAADVDEICLHRVDALLDRAVEREHLEPRRAAGAEHEAVSGRTGVDPHGDVLGGVLRTRLRLGARGGGRLTFRRGRLGHGGRLDETGAGQPRDTPGSIPPHRPPPTLDSYRRT